MKNLRQCSKFRFLSGYGKHALLGSRRPCFNVVVADSRLCLSFIRRLQSLNILTNFTYHALFDISKVFSIPHRFTGSGFIPYDMSRQTLQFAFASELAHKGLFGCCPFLSFLLSDSHHIKLIKM